MVRDTDYKHIHDKKRYKFFCFSNIIPIAASIMNGDVCTLIISSPNAKFISVLYDKIMESNPLIKIGNMQFRLCFLKIFSLKLPENHQFTITTGTPIIIRLPEQKYKEHGIMPKINYKYLYWRKEYPIDLFLSQIWINLLKKYFEYHNREYNHNNSISSFNLFSKLTFKKQISTKIFMKDREHIVIGSIWDFHFKQITNPEIVQFALDVGLGERNSLGFGFLNIKTTKTV